MISTYPNNRTFTSFSRWPLVIKPHGINALADVASASVWSPVVFHGNRRINDQFWYSACFALDFDNDPGDGMTTLAEARENLFADCRHIIGTTKSHGIDKAGKGIADRFRVVLFFERIVTSREDWVHTVRQTGKYLAGIDKVSWNPAQPYLPFKEVVSVNTDGFYIDVLQEPQEDIERRKKLVELRRRESQAYAAIGKMHPAVVAFLNSRVQPGQRNKAIFSAACRLAETTSLDFDGILGIISSSPTYKEHQNNAAFRREVVSTVKSAIRGVHGNG